MNIAKDDIIPTITMHDIVATMAMAGQHSPATHELVFPSCLVENPSYNPYEIDAKGVFLVGSHSRDKFVPIDEIAGKALIFDYDTRYDPLASTLLVLPKQIGEPLPFE